MDATVHFYAECHFTKPELVQFRAKNAMLARIATETPQRGTSEELEWRAGTDAQSKRDVHAPKIQCCGLNMSF